jgi:hypothetical protein
MAAEPLPVGRHGFWRWPTNLANVLLSGAEIVKDAALFGIPGGRRVAK